VEELTTVVVGDSLALMSHLGKVPWGDVALIRTYGISPAESWL